MQNNVITLNSFGTHTSSDNKSSTDDFRDIKKDFNLQLRPASKNQETIKLFEVILDIMKRDPNRKWTLRELANEANGPRYSGKVVNLVTNKIYTTVPEYSIQRCMCAKKQDVFAKDRDNRWYLQKAVLETSENVPKRKQVSDVYRRPDSSTLINVPMTTYKKKLKKLWQCIVEVMNKQPNKLWKAAELSQILNSSKYRGTILNNSFSGKAYDTISDTSVKVCLSAKKSLFDKLDKDAFMLRPGAITELKNSLASPVSKKRSHSESDLSTHDFIEKKPMISRKRRKNIAIEEDGDYKEYKKSPRSSRSTRATRMVKEEVDDIDPKFYEEPTLSCIV